MRDSVPLVLVSEEPGWLARVLERLLKPLAHLLPPLRREPAEQVRRAEVVLVAADDFSLPDVRETLGRLAARPEIGSVVLLSLAEPIELRHLVGAPVDEVFSLPDEIPRFRRFLQILSRPEETSAVRSLVVPASFHPKLREACRTLLRQADSETLGPPARSITALARSVGCSRSLLSQTASGAGLDLRRLIDLARVYWLLASGRPDESTLDEQAHALGYRSRSGIEALLRRVLGGGGVGELRRRRPESLAREMREELGA